MISTGGAPPRGKDDPLSELDIDELVERLTPGEIQKLLDECDPDDPHIPPSLRTNYKVSTLSPIIPRSLNRICPVIHTHVAHILLLIVREASNWSLKSKETYGLHQ